MSTSHGENAQIEIPLTLAGGAFATKVEESECWRDVE
jgi:hypothetical protein